MKKPAQKLRAFIEASGLIEDVDDMFERATVEEFAHAGREMGRLAKFGAAVERDLKARLEKMTKPNEAKAEAEKPAEEPAKTESDNEPVPFSQS